METDDRRLFIKSILPLIISSSFPGCQLKEKFDEKKNSSFVLWQLPPQTKTQMNSYIIKTTSGRIIVINGGCAGDAPYLREFLRNLGNNVDTWYISHPHFDHVDALIEILNNSSGIKINRILGSLPDEDWVEKYEPPALNTIKALNKSLKNYNYKDLQLGEMIKIDSVYFEILGIKNPEIVNDADFSPINNQSVVMLGRDDTKSILFTGDLGGGGGDKILNSSFGKKMKADYVQMSHHGQHGVYRSFYQAVQPKYCLWPTPCWLWNNDNGGGFNTGPWLTLEVRAWMEELDVKNHFVSCDGLYRID